MFKYLFKLIDKKGKHAIKGLSKTTLKTAYEISFCFQESKELYTKVLFKTSFVRDKEKKKLGGVPLLPNYIINHCLLEVSGKIDANE